jgi:hypothetical protein
MFARLSSNELLRWKSVKFLVVIEKLLTNHASDYPNLAKLAAVTLVLVLSNAACEGGFALMKLIKGPQQNRMQTETMSTRMTVKIHGPDFDDEASVMALCRHVASEFWKGDVTRLEKKAEGGRAGAASKAKNN